MTLTIKQIQAKMELIFKKYRKNRTYEEIQLIRDVLDDLADGLIIIDKRQGKTKTGVDKELKKKIMLVNSLKNNNPLWFV